MMKPDPSEVALRGCASGRPPLGTPRSKKSLKNSSKGEPGGNCGISGPACSRPRSDFSVCVVEMLTTDGSNFAARSAKLSGAGRATAGLDATVAGATTRKAATTLATARGASFEDRDDTKVNSSGKKRMIIFYRSFGASL